VKFLSKNFLKMIIVCVLLVIFVLPIFAQEVPLGEPFKVGVLGVLSGHAASWGLVCKYCAEASAKLINDEGGFIVDGTRHMVEVISADTKQDPKISVQGAQKLVYDENVKYIIGPNTDSTSISILPIIEEAKAICINYSFNKEGHSSPHNNSMLGMIANYQSSPIIYKYLIDNYGIKTISFVTANQTIGLTQREESAVVAKKLGLKILSKDVVYEPETSDFFPMLTKALKQKPDLLSFTAVSPSNAALLAKTARQLGYEGFMNTESSLDIKTLVEGAGKYADGFIYVGGGSTPKIRSEYMLKFMKEYIKIAGEWNDEAGTKMYALPMIIYTIQQAGEKALTDVEEFKKAIPEVKIPDPFIKKEYNKTLKWVGKSYFGQDHQIGVPMVITIVKNGKAEALFIGSVED